MKKYICELYYDLLLVPPYASQHSMWQCCYIFISHFGNIYNIFNFTNGRKLWILVLPSADLLYNSRYSCRIAEKARETK